MINHRRTATVGVWPPRQEYKMQKHTMALGYFFLALGCLYVSKHGPVVFGSTLLLASFVTFAVGVTFFIAATPPMLRTYTFLVGQHRKAKRQRSQEPSNSVQP